MTITVVVPIYNMLSTRGAGCIHRCLAALGEQTRPPDEICLVDSSDDGTTDLLPDLCPQAQVIHADQRLLSGAARNRGVEATSGEVVAFIDSDCVASSNWLEAIEQELQNHPDAPGATAPIRGPDDENLLARMDRLLHISYLLCLSRTDWTNTASTSGLAVRREAFLAVGGFDGSVLGNPDPILCRALVRRYGPLRVARRAWVEHLSRDTLDAVLFHQRRFGRGFVDGRSASPELQGAIALRYPALIPLLPIVRSLLLIGRLARYDRPGLATVLAHPFLLARLMAAWTRGVWEAAHGETSREWDISTERAGREAGGWESGGPRRPG